jgi:hypothetical protein
MERELPAEEDEVEEAGEMIEATAVATAEPTAQAVPPTAPAPKATAPARGTPTAKAPTVGRTPAAPAAAAEAPKKEDSGGWFGCQVTTNSGGDGSLLLLVGIAGVLLNRIRRKARR